MEGQRRVGRERAVEVPAGHRLLVDDEGADLGARQDVAAVAPHEEVLAGVAEVARRDVHRGDVVPAGLAGQPRPPDDRYRDAAFRQADPSREEQVGAAPEAGPAADVEHAGVLQEEVALLGEEEREARQVDLLLVHLDLGEVGVQREVQVEARRHAVFDVEAVLVEPGPVQASGYGVLPAAGQHVRRQPQIQAPVDPADAAQGACLAETGQLVFLGDRGPEDLLVLAPDVAHEVGAPHLRLGGGEAQRDHRDGDLRDPPVGRAARDGVPDAVPVHVDVRAVRAAEAALTLFGDLLLQLGAQRADDEHVARAAVLERVQDELKVVLVEQARRVAAHLGGDHAAGLRVVRLDADIQGARVVQQTDDRPLRCRRALGGLLLGECIDDRRRLPCRLVETPVDAGRLVHALRLDAVQLALGECRGLAAGCALREGTGSRRLGGSRGGRGEH